MRFFKLMLMFVAMFMVHATLASDDIKAGKRLYEQNCAVCHGATGGMDMSKRLAPPILGVKMHYAKKHQDKESFVAAVVSWLEKPEEGKSLMKMAIHKFNLMPTIHVSTEDAEKIANYMYEGKLDKPEGLDEHMKKMHGGKGHQHGKGKMGEGKKGECDGMKH